MQKFFTLAVQGFLLLLSGFFALAWIDNVTILGQWCWYVLIGGEFAREFTGWLPWFDFVGKMDYSTVSTYVPMAGFFHLWKGVRCVGKEHKGAASKSFPYEEGWAAEIAMYGLIGTVFGLFMFGYYNLNSVELKDLIVCLRTALLSTLVSLLWICPIDKRAKRWLQRWYNRTSLEGTAADRDVDTVVDDLGASLGRAGVQLGTFTAQVELATTKFASVADVQSALVGVAADLEHGAGAFRTESSKVLSGMLAVLDKLGKRVDAQDVELAAERAARQRAEARASKLEEDVLKRNRQETSRLRKLVSRAAALLVASADGEGGNHDPNPK